MKQKLLVFFLVLSVIMAVTPFSAEAAGVSGNGPCGENVYWTLEDGVLTISGTGQMTSYARRGFIISPDGTQIVGSSTPPWYYVRSDITTVVIEEGVTSIGSEAFWGLPEGISVTVPDSVTTIEREAFRMSGVKEVHLGNGVTSIGWGAFADCYNLVSLTLPDSVTTVDRYAFAWSGIEELNIGAGWTEIDVVELNDCTNLSAIHVSEENPSYSSDSNGVMFNKDKTVLLRCPQQMDGAYEIPDTVNSIFMWAFSYCSNLDSVEIPEGVTEIGHYAFYKCGDLTQIDLPEGLTSIVEGTFRNCSALTQVSIPSGLTTIVRHAFEGCSSLQNVELPESLTRLEFRAFADCTGLESVVFTGDAPEMFKVFEGVSTTVYYPAGNETWTEEVMGQYGGELTWVPYGSPNPDPHVHVYTDGLDGTCNTCGIHRETTEDRTVMHMFRMYDPNSGEHFYTGSTEERENLVAAGWNYEGVGFTFSRTTGLPVYRLYDPITGEHLYTMQEPVKTGTQYEGKDLYECEGRIWLYEGIAFNSAYDTEVPQYRLYNPNATRGAYHFTASIEERNYLISIGWEDQGICFYSSWK